MARRPITRNNPYTFRRGALAGQKVTSERQYRNVLAELKGFRNLGEQQRQDKLVQTPNDYKQLSRTEKERYAKAVKAKVLLQEGKAPSLQRAAQMVGMTVNTVLSYAGMAIKKQGRTYRADESARLPGVFSIPIKDDSTFGGHVETYVFTETEASLVGSYLNALRQYQRNGNGGYLRRFEGTTVEIDGEQVEFVTDRDTIDWLIQLGELDADKLTITGS